MKEEDYAAGYLYDHDQPEAFSGQDYFPEKMGRRTFYDPPERGFEREVDVFRQVHAERRVRRRDRGRRGILLPIPPGKPRLQPRHHRAKAVVGGIGQHGTGVDRGGLQPGLLARRRGVFGFLARAD